MKTFKPIEEEVLNDHNKVKMLFEQYKANCLTDEGVKYFNQISWELARHEVAEELIIWPKVRECVPDGKFLSDDALEDERTAKQALYDLNSMDPKTAEFDTKFREVFDTIILKHMGKEENIYLPSLIDRVPMEERINMGQKFENRKLIAPTRPHPWASDQYPFLETIEGVLLAPIDKFMDLFKSFPEKQKIPSQTQKTSQGTFETTSSTKHTST